MTETEMKEAKIFGSLLPAHEHIMPILGEVRDKYQIPEISPTDNEMKIFLRHEFEFKWSTIHDDILERIKEVPELLTEKAKAAYDAIKTLENNPLKDPELEKTSVEFRDNFQIFTDLIIRQYTPIMKQIDLYFHTIANHCVEYFFTGETRAIPENWLCSIDVIDTFGEEVIVLHANGAADPDEVAEKFKKKFRQTYGKKQPIFTEEHVKTADFLRLRWEGKSYLYILEEWELREPGELEKSSRRHPTSLRNKNDMIRQRFSRMEKELKKILL
jgi:hypothetical protein